MPRNEHRGLVRDRITRLCASEAFTISESNGVLYSAPSCRVYCSAENYVDFMITLKYLIYPRIGIQS